MIKLRSLDSKMNEIVGRLKQDKLYGHDLKPYTEKILKTALNFFEENEEYEKCIIISEKLNRFEHKNNYKKKES